MSPNRPARHRRSPFLHSLRTLLASATAIARLTAGAAHTASPPSAPAIDPPSAIESPVGLPAPLASAHVPPDPLQPPITGQAAVFVYDRIAVATGVARRRGGGWRCCDRSRAEALTECLPRPGIRTHTGDLRSQ